MVFNILNTIEGTLWQSYTDFSYLLIDFKIRFSVVFVLVNLVNNQCFQAHLFCCQLSNVNHSSDVSELFLSFFLFTKRVSGKHVGNDNARQPRISEKSADTETNSLYHDESVRSWMFFWWLVKRGLMLFRESGCMSDILALSNCPQSSLCLCFH